MTSNIPQHILNALTAVTMPRLSPEIISAESLRLAGIEVPVYRAGCVIVGSGAAGLRAAVEMKRRNDDVVVISQSAWGGTSACSGSDKQTLHTANTADRGDNFKTMARAIRAGGAMDEDTAYVEAVGSVRAMASLQFLGLPLPQDPLGGTLRYQTDHDAVGRATSCGPRTSRLMVKLLAEESIRLGVPFFNQTTAVKIVTEGAGDHRKVVGLLAMRARDRRDTNHLGLVLFACASVVLAAGGPGELYRDSVYPTGCFGVLGLALEAGIDVVNLTESQFGIGTRREEFPWNLSGSYLQVIPHIYSFDAKGTEHHFLAQYYRTTQEMASNIFRKGYQWPFHASRMLSFGSSLIDLAVYREKGAGRRVFMDFNRNPLPVPGDHPFDLDRLDDDASQYLDAAKADQAFPIQRLRHMNRLAIELYRHHKIDIAAAPLEFAVNHQHLNGGIRVDAWGCTRLAGCYAIGEAAGTHGVTRPGGAALNAGQVFGTRVAEHISASGKAKTAPNGNIESAAKAGLQELRAVIRPGSPLTVKAIRSEIQARMSDKAGFICHADGVTEALAMARRLNRDIRRLGIAFSRPSEAVQAIQWQQMALASEAILSALDFFIQSGGGSRGARVICDPDGQALPFTSSGPLDEFRFRLERDEHRDEQIVVALDKDVMTLSIRPNRKYDENTRSFFERDWPAWLMGDIYASSRF